MTTPQDPLADAGAGVLGRAGMPKPDCAKCGRPAHEGRTYYFPEYPRDCDGYEPIQSDTDTPSSKEHGGQLASLDAAQQRAMLRAHRITVLSQARLVCREERE